MWKMHAPLTSPDELIPQANSIPKLVELLQLLATGDRAALDRAFDRRARDYYLQAARAFGLVNLNLAGALTVRGQAVASAEPAHRMEQLRTAFAQSPCVVAWMSWQGVQDLSHVDPDTAAAFLRSCTSLDEETCDRRASTLRRWLLSLRPLELFMSPEQRRLAFAAADESARQQPPYEPEPWPDPALIPHNQGYSSVEQVLSPDLLAGGERLLICGYASLEHLISFLARGPGEGKIRLLLGQAPEGTRRRHYDAVPPRTMADEAKRYWLSRGFSPLSYRAVMHCCEMLRSGSLDARAWKAENGNLYARIYQTERATILGASDFTRSGLHDDVVSNTRFQPGSEWYEPARDFAERLWEMGEPCADTLRGTLESLLKFCTWEEAFAQACALLLEGEWAKRLFSDEEREALEHLWKHQFLGIAQALILLEQQGSVLITDAAGSGKTLMCAWLFRALHERRQQVVGSRYPAPTAVIPPAVLREWRKTFKQAGFRGVDLMRSSQLERQDEERFEDLQAARLLLVDEAHNFLNASSQRSQALRQHSADHVILLTATPINRSPRDILRLVQILGPDNFDEETIRQVNQLQKPRLASLRRQNREEFEQIKAGIERLTIRRTRAQLDSFARQNSESYLLKDGRYARYPEMKIEEYPLNGTPEDRAIASQIRTLAKQLKGITLLSKKLEMSAELGDRYSLDAAGYLRRLVGGLSALAQYNIMDNLRSSRAALFEHVHGTWAALDEFLPGSHREPKERRTGVLRSLRERAGNIPEWKLSLALLESTRLDPALQWLVDPDEHRRACEDDERIYRTIAALVPQMSNAREITKQTLLLDLASTGKALLSFDHRLISLKVHAAALQNRGVDIKLFTGEGGAAAKKKAEAMLNDDAPKGPLIVLCSDVLSEGMNLQRASCVVHLDTPTVVRTAEQRAGRVDRMKTHNEQVSIWWPRDPKEFAPLRGEILWQRHKQVSDYIGANLRMPGEVLFQRTEDEQEITGRELAQWLASRPSSFVLDAFQPIRELIGVPHGLITQSLYDALKGARAAVRCYLSVFPAERPWAFMALAAREGHLPRWIFLTEAEIVTDIRAITDRLRLVLRPGVEGRGIASKGPVL